MFLKKKNKHLQKQLKKNPCKPKGNFKTSEY